MICPLPFADLATVLNAEHKTYKGGVIFYNADFVIQLNVDLYGRFAARHTILNLHTNKISSVWILSSEVNAYELNMTKICSLYRAFDTAYKEARNIALNIYFEDIKYYLDDTSIYKLFVYHKRLHFDPKQLTRRQLLVLTRILRNTKHIPTFLRSTESILNKLMEWHS